MKMMVSCLPANYDKYDLQRLFSPFGWVAYAKIYIDPITMKSRRKGLVEIEDDGQALKAIEALQGKMLGPNPLLIKEMKEKKRGEY
jgi:RNA recognition motif-containing protein